MVSEISGKRRRITDRNSKPDILGMLRSEMITSGRNCLSCKRASKPGVLADAFYAKGLEHPETLLDNVADLIETSAARARAHQEESAPVWIPRNGKDSNGIPYIVITCTECLRSFPLNVTKEENPEVLETLCLFCANKVKYIIDFSLSVTSPPKTLSAPIPAARAAG